LVQYSAYFLQISINTLQIFLQFLISSFSFCLFSFFFFFFWLPRLRVHPQLSHSGYPVDGVLVDAGSLWPKRVRETNTHTLGLWVSEEFKKSVELGGWRINNSVQSRVSSDSNWTLNEVETWQMWGGQTKPKKAPNFIYFRVLLYYYSLWSFFFFFFFSNFGFFLSDTGGEMGYCSSVFWASCCFALLCLHNGE
jgi:hypothetical protein